MGIGDKWRFLSSKWKYAIGIGIIVCMIALVYCGNVYAKNKLEKQISKSGINMKSSRMDELLKINAKIPLFFDEKDANFLAETVTEEQIAVLEKEVDQVTTVNKNEGTDSEDTDYEKEVVKAQEGVQKIKQTYETKKAINSLYKKDHEASAIKGSVVNKELPIANDLKKDTFEKIKKSYFKIGDAQPYEKTINDLLTNAENQLTQIEKAKTELEKIYKDNKVVSTDLTLYESAKAETDKIKNEKIKKTFSDQLEKVKKEIDAKGNETIESTDPSTNTEQDQSSDSTNDHSYQNPTDGGQGNDYGYNDYTPDDNNAGGTGITPPTDNNTGNSNGGDSSDQTGDIGGNGQGENPPEESNDGGNDTANSGEQPTGNSSN